MTKYNLKGIKVLSIVSVITFLLSGCNEVTVDEHIANAKKLTASNDTAGAIIELKNAIQQAPNQASPRLLLGNIYLERGQFSSAEKEFQRALRNDADKGRVYPLLARSQLALSKTEDVIDLVVQTEGLQLPPAVMVDLYALKSLAQIKQGDVEEAKSTYKLAENTQLNSLYKVLSQASLAAIDDNNSEALQLVSEQSKAYSENSDVWLLKGHIESAMQDHIAASKSYQRAVDTAPKATQYTLFLAQALVRSEQYEAAKPYVANIVKAFPNNILGNELNATLLYADKKMEDARIYADKAIQNGSRNLTTYLIAGVTNYQQDKLEKANEYFLKILPYVPEDHLVKRLYIATQFKLGNIDSALKDLETINVNSKENSDFLVDMSLEMSRLGRSDEAITLAEKAHRYAPQSNTLKLGLIQLANNDTSGFDTLDQALEMNPQDTKASLALVYFNLKRNNTKEAHRILKSWLANNPDDSNALYLQGLTFQAEKNFPQARVWLDKALEITPSSMPAQLALAHLAGLEGDIEQAFQNTIAIANQHPTSTTVQNQLFRLAKQTDNQNIAVQLYDKFNDDNDLDNIMTRYNLARAYALSAQPAQAIEVLNKFTPAQHTQQSLQLLTALYRTSKDNKSALAQAEKWLSRDGLNPQAYIQTIQLRESVGDYRQALSLTDKAILTFPSHTSFPLMKAGLYIRSNELKKSQQVLDTQSDKVKKSPYFLRLQAVIYTQQGQLKQAIASYKQRFEYNPNLAAAKDLATAYLQDNDNTSAITFLDNTITKYGEKAQSLEILLAQAQIKAVPDKAITTYQAILKREPKNVIALNNLAWLHLDNHNYPQALSSAEKAYAIAGTYPEIQDTYGYSLLKMGEAVSSLNPLRLAYQAKQNSTEIALHYVESLLANHKTQAAKEILDTLQPQDETHKQLKIKLEQQLK